MGEDNQTIVHHKVAARVLCVLTEQDAQAAARAEAQQSPSSYGNLGSQSSGGPNAFNFAGGTAGSSNGMPGAARRSTMQPQGLVGMGGMGGNARPPGKSGLTFDHILSRLQGELQKSRETGAELHSLTGAMNDIHETLGGNMVRLDYKPILSLLNMLFSQVRPPTLKHFHPLYLHQPPNLQNPISLCQRQRPKAKSRHQLSTTFSPSFMRHSSLLQAMWRKFVHWRACWLSTKRLNERYPR